MGNAWTNTACICGCTARMFDMVIFYTVHGSCSYARSMFGATYASFLFHILFSRSRGGGCGTFIFVKVKHKISFENLYLIHL